MCLDKSEECAHFLMQWSNGHGFSPIWIGIWNDKLQNSASHLHILSMIWMSVTKNSMQTTWCTDHIYIAFHQCEHASILVCLEVCKNDYCAHISMAFLQHEYACVLIS